MEVAVRLSERETGRLRPKPFRDLQSWLDQVEAFWSEQLESFKAVAEGTSAQKTAASGKGRKAGSS